MPRDLPLGNGKLLITFDANYQLRDFHFPRVGGENHSGGHPFRFGVWCDGQFGWVHNDDWSRSMDYNDNTLITDVDLQCDRMGLSIHCADAVDFHENIWIRRITVKNQWDSARDARFFFHHDFHISDFEVGDTAYYHPDLKVLFHY